MDSKEFCNFVRDTPFSSQTPIAEQFAQFLQTWNVTPRKQMAKSTAERMREYRARKKLAKNEDEWSVPRETKYKPPPLSAKERSRKYRLRKKLRENTNTAENVDEKVEIREINEDYNIVFSTDQCFEQQLETEISSENSLSTKKFVCSKCDRLFSSKHSLKRHLNSRTCLKPKFKEYRCSKCHNTFTTKRSLIRHVQELICSRPAKPKITTSIFKCSTCNNPFTSNYALQRHLDNETCSKPLEDRNSTVRVFVCSKCNCIFPNRLSLQRHTDSQICLNSLPVSSEINPKLFEEWEKAIRRGDRRLTPRDKVCQLHFRKEFITTHDRVVLSNGDVFMSKRRKLRLAKEAIPTIFPDVPLIFDEKKTKNRRSSARRHASENDTSVKKRRLETLFGDSFTKASKDTVQEKKPTVHQNTTIKFILDDSPTDATENNIQVPSVNENATVDDILGDSRTDALGDSVQEPQHAVNENSVMRDILGDSHTDETEDSIHQRLPILEPRPITDLPDDSITIEDNVLEVQHTGKHNPVTIWIKEEDDCVNEFADSTAIEHFDDLLHKCSKIEFPDARWTYVIVAENILITYWTASFECSKKIIIDQNLKITAFIKDVGIIIDETEVHDLNTVKNVVKKLHEIKECAYNPAKSIRWKCRGFVKQNKIYCSSCSSELDKDRLFKKKAD